MFGEHLSCWSVDGYEVDESEKLKLQMFEEELLMKQFAVGSTSYFIWENRCL